MFRVLVLSAVLAIAVAKPTSFYNAPLAYYVRAFPGAAVPAAVSHQYRYDFFNKPVVATYAAPAFDDVPYYVTSYATDPVVASQAEYVVPTSDVAVTADVEDAPEVDEANPTVVKTASAPEIVNAAPVNIQDAPEVNIPDAGTADTKNVDCSKVDLATGLTDEELEKIYKENKDAYGD